MEEEALTNDVGDESAIASRLGLEEFDDDEDARWKRLLPTVYAILRRLEVSVQIASSLIVVPRSSIYAPLSASFLSSFESRARRRLLPHCLCLTTPRIDVASVAGKDFVIEEGMNRLRRKLCFSFFFFFFFFSSFLFLSPFFLSFIL